MLDLSIIIVNWNTRDLLAQCLQAVFSAAGGVPIEVIVVDNASADGSPELVQRDFPQVRLIQNAANVGFARANNQGITVSQGRYVLLLNSDAFVCEDTLEHMVAFMEAHPAAGLAGCKLLYKDGRLQPSCMAFPSLLTEFFIATWLDRLFPRSRLFGHYRMTYWDFGDVREVDVITGAFMMARAAAIDQVGLLDEGYFMYSEEVDWCYRFKAAGWKVLYSPGAETVHIGEGSSRKIRADMLIQLYRSRICFFRKTHGRRSAVLLKLIIGLNCLLRVGPGAVYYLPGGKRARREKYGAFWRLLMLLPGL
jgi:GT2 family glycosyltransferase